MVTEVLPPTVPISPTEQSQDQGDIEKCQECQGELVWLKCGEGAGEECEWMKMLGVLKQTGKVKVKELEERKKKREGKRTESEENDEEARAAVEEGGEAEENVAERRRGQGRERAKGQRES